MRSDLQHGGALDAMMQAFPDAPRPWIDLSTGINPWPYPHAVLADTAMTRLPSQSARNACRSAMAGALGLLPDCILLAPGSELLIRLLPILIKPRRALILSPSYGDHERVWQAAGVKVQRAANPLDGLADSDADLAVICNPNNPDGRRFEPAALLAAAQLLHNRNGWLIVDEAFCDLDPALSVASQGGMPGLVVLRSFGKFFGLAGLRLGAMVAPSRLCEAMTANLGVWPVSGPALAVGSRAYADSHWQAEMRERLAHARQHLDGLLRSGGLSVVGGTNLFAYVCVGDAWSLWTRLAEAGIYARRFGWSKHHLRFGLPPDEQAAERLMRVLSLSA